MSFNNLGKPVCAQRARAAESDLLAMLPEASSEQRLSILQAFSDRVQRDQVAELLCADPDEPIDLLDLTGRYRLLACLLAEPK